ncbi:MAG: hypothetical protein A3G87_10130 [Omnitrophica bacterium RIFCSPLOWO2_12_FULL_50_11]|nr:MAG: hypothetical protein A3G87_10130 [Omnitrophica bacterium RIFCSPLOWO2_12_FULL_50_11]
MPRNILYAALTLAALGTLAFGFSGKPELAAGWWLGIGAGLLNYSWLLSSVRRVQAGLEQEAAKSKRRLTGAFLIRYFALALVFFLALKLGRPQLGSCFVGFGSLYIVLFIDYFMRVRKQRT